MLRTQFLTLLTSKCASRHNFSTCQLREWCVLYILAWKCASRHNGVHFFDSSTCKSAPNLSVFNTFDFEMCLAPQGRAIFISHLARWLRTCRFSEPTFDPPEPQISRKTQCFAIFLPFRAPASSFFFHSFSSLIFSLLLFSFQTLPTSAFPSAHIAGSFTSKLPSISIHYGRQDSCFMVHIHVWKPLGWETEGHQTPSGGQKPGSSV